ncbi:Hypothetical Protein FCC1311_075132 [Hondaea fermentalgiana]|uniref:Uncharacterized protein n=1 Tax=Hondaea fermentalgiana TaxID=2315210 RepID=A0A2R5GK86_9STRA|nr:Hypothetical Protein FCC1311_075132 [Hondaea fermentalgiana]|eukprot:GBG31290.1 Hypothetical Protein FCC1311_075132 [Hondaea fermentalgiana]
MRQPGRQARSCRLQSSTIPRRIAEELAEEENRKFDQEIAQRRAKEKREGFSSMFKPKLSPLKSKSLTSIVDDDDEIDDIEGGGGGREGQEPHEGSSAGLDAGGSSGLTSASAFYGDGDSDDENDKEHEMFLPPPAQLESLLPVPMGSKQEFLRTLRAYKKSQEELHRVRIREKRRLRDLAEQRRRLIEDEKRRLRHEALLRHAVARMRNRGLYTAFVGWHEHVKLEKRRRLLAGFSSSYMKEWTFGHWHSWVRKSKEDRLCSALIVQASWRRFLAQQELARRRRNLQATLTIQAFARTVLAKVVLKLARRKIAHQEKLVRRMLLRMSSNAKFRTFSGWKRFVRVRQHVRVLAGRADGHRVRYSWDMWRRNAATIRRERHKAAVRDIQRVGRGFVGRLETRRKRRDRNAAIIIQQMVRARIARNVLRTKLRQRRVIKRKLAKIFGERKRARFASWRTFIIQRKTLRRMMQGSRFRTIEGAFARWSSRYHASLDIQRFFRGYLGRQAFMARQQEYLFEMAEGGCRTLGERQKMKLLFDERYSSPLLTELRKNLLHIKRLALVMERKRSAEALLEARREIDQGGRVPLWQLSRHSRDGAFMTREEQEAENLLKGFTQEELEHDGIVVMWVHGAPQRFDVETHAAFLEDILMKDIQKEIARLQREMNESAETMRREDAEWKETLERYLHRKKHLLNMTDVRLYPNAGKSFELSFTDPEDVRETICSWLDMVEREFISRWTLLAWVAHGMILRRGIRAKERLLIWGVLMEELEPSLVDELAALMLQIMTAQDSA